MHSSIKDIISKFPPEIKAFFQNISYENLSEIRFRLNRPIMLSYGGQTGQALNRYLAQERDIKSVFTALCENSVYAHLNEIKNGFITFSGGHRVGISGRCVISGGKIENFSNLSGINIRIAREFIGCSLPLMPYIKNGKAIKNTLIIGPPSSGKTTLLRDIARVLSGEMKITIVDERSEIASAKNGVFAFDLGPQTDVYDSCPKNLGMLMALRALSPDIIITDEIGSKDDFDAIGSVINSGCKIITSLHGYSVASLNDEKKRLASLFDTLICIERKNNEPHIIYAGNMEGNTLA